MARKKNTAITNVEPASGVMQRSGEFKGDLRDLPKTNPVRQDRPKREDPKVVPRPYPTPGSEK